MSVPGNNGMEQLIPIINKLQNACTDAGRPLQLDLPQIAVIGCQSAGKSSVLENFVGRDFLPRGNGIVTRRPLILQLENSNKECGIFTHRPDVYEDFDEIRTEIEEDTDRITGNNKGISSQPIILSIFSPHVLNVTLVDLPGLTKVPIGDQPADIEAQTREMILNYIKKPNCLILAVSPANTDLANSDALKLAREVDPDGDRTIGVSTKLDLMDQGTDARNVLENKLFPLQRGYVGVVNRSQKDIEGKKDIQAALKSEEEFFVMHPSYNHMAERCGTVHLQRVLNRELTEHIHKSIPGLLDELQKKKNHFQEEVNRYKDVHITDPNEMKHKLLAIAQKLSADFNSTIGAFDLEFVHSDHLSSGARINKIFFERLPNEIARIDFYSKELFDKMNLTIRNINGIRCGLYSPQVAFEMFAKNQIAELKNPVTLCIDLVFEELQVAVRECTNEKMIIYPKLRLHLKKIIKKYIEEIEQKAKQSVLSLIEIEMAYMNTNKIDFPTAADDGNPDSSKSGPEPSKLKSAVRSKMERDISLYELDDAVSKKKSEVELHKEVMDIYEKILIYIEHVKDNLQDMIPKACTLYIIKDLMNYIRYQVIPHLMDITGNDLPKMFEMDGMDTMKYTAASKMLAACKEAFEAIHELPDQINAISTHAGKMTQ